MNEREIAGTILMGTALLLYFVPTIVAVARQKRSLLAITLLNFFLAWTILGWIAALVWASARDNAH